RTYVMRWVDCCSYYGPDRRVSPPGLRIRERRRDDLADDAPPLARELRHLRMQVLESDGPLTLRIFADRALALAALAESQNEAPVADFLRGLAESRVRCWASDRRDFIYEQLDRLYTVMRTLH